MVKLRRLRMPTARECLAPGFLRTMVPKPSLISSRSFRLTSLVLIAAASHCARFLKSTSKAWGYVNRSSSSGRKKRCWERPASCSVCIPKSVAFVVTAMDLPSVLPDAHFALIGVEGIDFVREDAADRHFLGSQCDETVTLVQHHRLGGHHVLGHA